MGEPKFVILYLNEEPLKYVPINYQGKIEYGKVIAECPIITKRENDYVIKVDNQTDEDILNVIENKEFNTEICSSLNVPVENTMTIIPKIDPDCIDETENQENDTKVDCNFETSQQTNENEFEKSKTRYDEESEAAYALGLFVKGLEIIEGRPLDSDHITQQNTKNTIKIEKCDEYQSSDENQLADNTCGKLISIGRNGTKIPLNVAITLNWEKYNKAGRNLLEAIFTRTMLATHSLSGKASPAFPNKKTKPALNKEKVEDFIQYCQENVENWDLDDIRKLITSKCADEGKNKNETTNRKSIYSPDSGINNSENEFEEIESDETIFLNPISKNATKYKLGKNGTEVDLNALEKINWTNKRLAIRKLLTLVFTREALAAHSLTGHKSPAFKNKNPKPALHTKTVQDIISYCTVEKCCSLKLVHFVITSKCADESKMKKNRIERNKS